MITEQEHNLWKEQVLALYSKLNRVFCWKRKSKMNQLSELMGEASQHIEYCSSRMYHKKEVQDIIEKVENGLGL